MHPDCLPVGGGSHASLMVPGRAASPSRANGVFVRRARRR
ncbi:mkiaa2009 protein [Burkholderia pseudomallei 305]|nr:mkiaa2009 protein [Burkholderia pseudomallei 305]